MIYIFDLDGTLALITHRRHHVEPPSRQCYDCGGKNAKNCVQCADLDAGWKANWRKFYAECVDDAPNWPVITMLQMVLREGHTVKIFSGRSDEMRAQTVDWLTSYTGISHNVVQGMLTMRRAGDYTPDDQLKHAWFLALPDTERCDIGGVFEDRDRMVAMWRKLGLPCFQVAEGEF